MPARAPIHPTRHRRRAAGVLLAGIGLLATALPTAAQERTVIPGQTAIVSRSSGNNASNGDSHGDVVSADGRFVAFQTSATTLTPLDPSAMSDVVIRNLETGTTTLVSKSSPSLGSVQSNGGSTFPSVSGDGVLVSFTSNANNLVADDTNTKSDIFVHNRANATTARVSVATGGAQGNGSVGVSAISASGRYVAFESQATNLATGTTGNNQIYVHDRVTGTTELVSRADAATPGGGAVADAASYAPAISSDGRFVAFASEAMNLVDDITPANTLQIFLRDRRTGATTLISKSSVGEPADLPSYAPSMSANARYIAFESQASNLDEDHAPAGSDIFVHDRTTGDTTIQSLDPAGEPSNGSAAQPWMSADGRTVTFESTATDLVADDENEAIDIFQRPIAGGPTHRLSVNGVAGEGDDYSRDATASWNGGVVSFHSAATNLVAGDLNELLDVFARTQDEPVGCDSQFSDVPDDHGFCPEIDWLASSGITGGFDDGTFRPTVTLTRQGMAAFLYRAAGEPDFTPPSTPTFSDVRAGHPFRTEIEWLAASGITGGFDDGLFRPGLKVTRQAMAAFLFRAAGEPPTLGFPPDFDDVDLDHPFYDEIRWLVSKEITTGFDDDTFRPSQGLSRQAMAAFLQRFSRVGLAPT